MDKQQILKVLSQVYDPDYVNRSIIDMGLVTEDDIVINDNKIEVTYTLTASICPFSAAIGLMIKYALEKKLGVPVTVKLRPGHYKQEAVAEPFENTGRLEELTGKLTEFGVLERCVR